MDVGQRQARLVSDLVIESLPVLAQAFQYDVHHPPFAVLSVEYSASTRRAAQSYVL